jgi:20S proteasome alpha/beta subunit
MLSPWTPIGAVQTASGYDVAWKIPGADLYTVWATDSSGNYTSNVIGAVSGASPALEALETTFNQDLNGDGAIGVPSAPLPSAPPIGTVIQTDGSTSLTEVGNNYFLYDGGSGPELKFDGAAVDPGMLGAWTPIGAVQTASGYDVAWKIPGAGEYTVWATDSSGNYTSNVIGAVSGTSAALEALETTFNQDLNGDGTIGAPSAPAPAPVATTTVVTEVGSNYFLYENGSGPELKFDGAAVGPSMVQPWTPIGAVQTGSGYDIAWKMAGADLYTVWATDASGNYTSNVIGAVAGSSNALESLETTFNQDLNGDGTIGVRAGSSSVSSFSHATGAEATTIGVDAVVEFAATPAGPVAFEGSTGTLRLDDAPAFNAEIFNFSGDGTLSGSDQIDLRDIDFNTVHDSYANGVLTVSDGTNTATLDFNGSYVLANFSFASDGGSGTIVYDPPVSNASTSSVPAGQAHGKGSEQASALVVSNHDNFVFPSKFDGASATDHVHDAMTLGQNEAAHVAALLAALHGDSHASGATDMLALTPPPIDHLHYGDFFVK